MDSFFQTALIIIAGAAVIILIDKITVNVMFGTSVRAQTAGIMGRCHIFISANKLPINVLIVTKQTNKQNSKIVIILS